MDQDRRATLEAAFDAAEEGLQQAAEPKPAESAPAVESEPSPSSSGGSESSSSQLSAEAEASGSPKTEISDETPAPKEEVVEAEAKPVNTDRPPQAWKAAQKAKWETLPPDVRQEVLRREHETTRVLNETAQVRQFTTQFQQAIQPYMARIQQVGNPIVAIQNLLAADHLLASGPKAQKAQYLARLIKDYGVDIHELDAALAGTAPVDPVESRVEQLLQERLTPFQQYIAQQQQAEQARQRQTQESLAAQITAMSQDPAYPHFEEVRDAMADIIEIQAKRGVSIDLKTAYNRAVAADPRISQEIMQTRQAASANAQAQRALKASASVKGAPTGSVAGKPLDRRGQIEAAIASLEGR